MDSGFRTEYYALETLVSSEASRIYQKIICKALIKLLNTPQPTM